jgi:hypothetical protein
MANQIQTIALATVEDWQDQQMQMRLQIEQFDTQMTARRSAELIGMLETASTKIDRFGWDRMADVLKDQLTSDWCRVLEVFALADVSAGVDAVFDDAGGKLRSINEFQVKAQILISHGKICALLPKRGAQAHVPIVLDDAERKRRAAVCDELGMGLKRIPRGAS